MNRSNKAIILVGILCTVIGIHNVIGDQRHMSAAIEHAIEKVHGSTTNVEKTARDLEGIVHLLRNESESLLSESQNFILRQEESSAVQGREIGGEAAGCPV